MIAEQTTAKPSGPPRRLLVVEDDADMLLWLGEVTRHPWISLDVADNGIEAVARARMLRPAAVLLDVYLPGMDGLEIFRVLRHEMPEARVILLSARVPPGAFALAMEHGAFAALRKPVPPQVLRRKILEALNLPPERDSGRAPRSWFAQAAMPDADLEGHPHQGARP